MKKQHVTLTEDHQTNLGQLLSKGSLSAKTVKQAMALLELQQGKTFQQVAQTLHTNYDTVSAWATKYQTNQLSFLIRLVQDNLNTHSVNAFYACLPADEAAALAARFERLSVVRS